MTDDTQKMLAFSDHLDKLLQTGSVVDNPLDEFGDLLDVAHKLSTTDFSRESHIRQPLYSRLQTSQSAASTNIWQRKLLLASLSTIILLAIIFTMPPIRAFAQEIIKHLQTITLTNGPSPIEPYLTGTPPADITDHNPPPPNLSLEEAITKAGFTPLVPTYLPDGYVLTFRDARVGQVTSEFEPAGIDTSKCCVVFSIRQLWGGPEAKHSTYQYPVGNVPIADVLVRNRHGLWVQNAEIGMTPDENGKFHIMPANLLTWEEGDYLFWMTSFDVRTNIPLLKDEMMQVANSLQLPSK